MWIVVRPVIVSQGLRTCPVIISGGVADSWDVSYANTQACDPRVKIIKIVPFLSDQTPMFPGSQEAVLELEIVPKSSQGPIIPY